MSKAESEVKSESEILKPDGPRRVLRLRNIENYEQFKQALDTELANQAAGFVRTGYLLKKARDTDILASSGYSTVAEFAKYRLMSTEKLDMNTRKKGCIQDTETRALSC